MDINKFLLDNASAVIGLLGVIAGAILTSVPIILLQLFQRKWYIEDDKRQWRRERLIHRLTPIQEWLDSTLCFTQAFIQWLRDDNDGSKPVDFFDVLEDDLRQNFKDHQQHEAIIFSHAVSTGDEELLKLIDGFIEIRSKYIDSINENNKAMTEAHRIVLDAVASKTARRIEFLLEEANPIGGPYHNKPTFHIFRRKPKSLTEHPNK